MNIVKIYSIDAYVYVIPIQYILMQRHNSKSLSEKVIIIILYILYWRAQVIPRNTYISKYEIYETFFKHILNTFRIIYEILGMTSWVCGGVSIYTTSFFNITFKHIIYSILHQGRRIKCKERVYKRYII